MRQRLFVIRSFGFKAFFVKGRVERVEVLAVELIGQQTQILAEALIMHDLARPEETDRINDVGIIAEAQDVVVGSTCFLFPKGVVNMTYRKYV